MNFYFDENIPKKIAHALNAIEGDDSPVNVYHTEEVWEKGIKDIDLFEKISKKKGILFTNDLKILSRKIELNKVVELGISVVAISFPSGSSYEQKYQKIFKYWEIVKKDMKKANSAIILKIKNNNTTEIIKT